MNFKRDHLNTYKILYLFLLFFGITIMLFSLFQLKWYWNFITLPLGLFILLFSYKNFKKQNRIITAIEFQDEKVVLKFINSPQKEIPNNKFAYAILVQKFYKPVRAIEFKEKRKIGLLKSKKIGTIEIGQWTDIKKIAQFAIQKDFKRDKWNFGWNWGELLMIFAFFLGTTELIASEYIGEIKLESKLSDGLLDIGDAMANSKHSKIENSKKAEDKFLKK